MMLPGFLGFAGSVIWQECWWGYIMSVKRALIVIYQLNEQHAPLTLLTHAPLYFLVTVSGTKSMDALHV